MNGDPLIQIKIEYEKLGKLNAKIIYLNGRITLGNSMEVSNKLKNLFSDENYNIIIDLSNLQYLDSKGMAMLLTLEKTVKENGGTLLVTKANEFVQELFNLTNLNTYFTFVDNLDKGRSYFTSLGNSKGNSKKSND